MNFVKFCENRYQELQLESGKSDAFDALNDSETKAVHQLLNSYRTLLKWVMMPKCMYDFASVQLGYKKEPKPVLLNKLKAEKKAAQAAQEAQLKAVETPLSESTDKIH